MSRLSGLLHAVITDAWSKRVFLIVTVVSLVTVLSTRLMSALMLGYLSVFGTLISLAGFLLAAYIATRQDRQMEELGTKSDKQKEALEKARKDQEIVDRARTFFRADQVGKTPYICIRLEKEVDGENLPFTPTSEDFCLGVLTVMLKERCDRSLQVVGHDLSGVLARELSEYPERARIFFNHRVCAENLMEGKGVDEVVKTLPLWIRPESGTVDGSTQVQLCIWERALHESLNPTEFRDGGNRYYGLLGRFARDRSLTFIMSGVSQMGTLVVGNFVDKILTYQEEPAQNALSLSPNEYATLMGESDFLAVLVGVRSSDSREVENLNCEAIWYDNGGIWQRL